MPASPASAPRERLAAAGLRVILAEQDACLGAGALLDERWHGWRAAALRDLQGLANLRCLPGTTVLGAYGHGVFGALEVLAPAQAQRCGLRERLHVLRVRRVVLATGAVERLLAFPGNDTPGVMLAGAALAYLRRYGVAVGARPVFFTNADEAYESAHRPERRRRARARSSTCAPRRRRRSAPAPLGMPVHTDSMIVGVHGRAAVRARLRQRARWLPPAHARGRLCAGFGRAFTAHGTRDAGGRGRSAGARIWSPSPPSSRARSARSPGPRTASSGSPRRPLTASGRRARSQPNSAAASRPWPTPAAPPDPPRARSAAFFEVRGPGKSFVDLQNDVTAEDVRLAHREGYEHVEHMKRYTTHGMATDQGRIGGLLGSAVLAQARGVPRRRGRAVPKPRPYAQPVPFAALAGAEVREHYKPKRRLPLHDWHAAAGATFVATGLWLRPLVYSRSPGWAAVLEEARAVRSGVGLTDVSTLGKIDVQGPDAARFLDFIYANTFSTLAVGRARYGIMLREDGMLFDDGTTARLAPEHFLITTTTANATAVLEHMEFQLQAHCAHLEVSLTRRRRSVGAVRARRSALARRDRRAAARGGSVRGGLPLHGGRAASASPGSPARLFRISFSGELAYELAVPARHALSAWSALLRSRRAVRPASLRTRCTQHPAHREGTRDDGGAQRQHQRRRPRLRAPAEEAG